MYFTIYVDRLYSIAGLFLGGHKIKYKSLGHSYNTNSILYSFNYFKNNSIFFVFKSASKIYDHRLVVMEDLLSIINTVIG